MKKILFAIFSLALFACNQQTDNTELLQERINKLEHKLADTYKPGLGDFMSRIQTQHAKLWFAGQNENWALANFEIHEIEETLEDIEKYQAGRKEMEMIQMLDAPLDSIEKAIEQKNSEAFKRNFITLTNTCNTCHIAVDFGFNVIKIPDSSPFGNQDFRSLN